jgi:hypothetical protein
MSLCGRTNRAWVVDEAIAEKSDLAVLPRSIVFFFCSPGLHTDSMGVCCAWILPASIICVSKFVFAGRQGEEKQVLSRPSFTG